MSSRFLLEIGCEEIPDWMISGALEHLRDAFTKLLETHKLKGEVEWVDATPRRLVLRAAGLPKGQKDSVEVVSGPPVAAGEGAKQGFAKKQGVDPAALETLKTDKGEYFAYRKQVTGKPTEEILAVGLPGIISSIPWPKAMSWPGSNGARFIRPVRWIVALLQNEVVPFEFAGVKAGKETRGHRRMGPRLKDGAPKPIGVSLANYEIKLRDAGVMVRAGDRREKIQNEIAALLPHGSTVKPDDALLDTLTFITEWPAAILGGFDPSYLELPQEVLIEVMRAHQKYFSVLLPDGKLAPHFIAVMNTRGDEDGLVRSGNERVLRARFNDARFFYEKDVERKLADRVEDLKNVTFQAKLGSYYDKTQRVVELVKELGGTEAAQRAALLAKADLGTDMVKEFTDLQGIIGGLYAKATGESQAVGDTIYDHYKPLSMDGAIPRTHDGQIVALADKLDTLRGAFGIGMIPTGSKDPFALRRAAQGVIKILTEGGHELPFDILSGRLYNNPPARFSDLHDFFLDRVRYYFKDIRGFAYDEVSAVLAAGITTLPDVLARLEAVQKVRSTPDFEPLAAAFKRIRNILEQANFTGGSVKPELIADDPSPERNLWLAIGALPFEGLSYRDRLSAVASLRDKVDTFFMVVMVNVPEVDKRNNRLALLSSLRDRVSRIADLSEIVTSN
jgi:glycyl-tRNA synthetase beta chain